jgi:hypothetical protein
LILAFAKWFWQKRKTGRADSNYCSENRFESARSHTNGESQNLSFWYLRQVTHRNFLGGLVLCKNRSAQISNASNDLHFTRLHITLKIIFGMRKLVVFGRMNTECNRWVNRSD